ncbi:hypothetical protein FS749_002918 [Ceratobasidium sp. UAMH 11750]|nr:hypothetical protein FS749_002918 [Ceratobasidium sp. UAMH 11750]
MQAAGAIPPPAAGASQRTQGQQAQQQNQQAQAAAQAPVQPMAANEAEVGGDQEAAGENDEDEQPLPPDRLDEALEAHTAARQKRLQIMQHFACTGRHDLGAMYVKCTHCGALHWDMEKLSKS